MATGSDAEAYRDGSAPAVLEFYGPKSYRPSAGTVVVQGLFEAVGSATFDLPDGPVYLRGRYGGRLGSLVEANHPILKAHPELFEELTLPVDFPLQA